MARLPEIQKRGAVTRGPQSSVTAADVANPYRQIAEGLGAIGQAFQAKEQEDAINDGQNATYRDADGNLRVDTRSNFSATNRAYNRAAQQGYTARLAGDIRARGVAIANEARGNIDTFNSSWKSFRDQTLIAVPKEFRGAVTTMLDTEGPRFGLGVSEQKRTSDLKEFEGNIKAEIQLLDDDLSTLARGGGTATDAYRQKQDQLKTLWGELAGNPDFTVGEKEAAIAVQRMESRHTSEAMLGTVDKVLQTGGIAEARKVAQTIITDETLSLSPAERRQYAGLANERINGFVAQSKANLKPVQDRSAAIQKRLKEGLGLDNDDIDLTASELARGGDMAGAIELYSSRAIAKTLQGFTLSDNRTQVGMAEGLFSQANGGADIISAIQQVESSGNADAVSGKGAAGLMQVMPETAPEIAGELGDANFPAGGTREEIQAYLKDPAVSKEYGTHYFNKMMTRYRGDEEAALIAYNGGASRADAWLAAGRDDSVIPRESADYYKKVLGAKASVTRFTPEEVTVAKQFLQSRTNKDASHIDGMKDGFSVKISRLFEAAPAGIREKLGIFSGARSVERQTQLWEEAKKKYGSAGEARKWVAPPPGVEGSTGSRHNHGDAADLSFNGESLSRAPKEVVDWLHSNAGQFGLKFPLSNENWHIEDDSTRGGGGSSPQVDPEIVKEYRAEMTRDSRTLFDDIKAGYDKGLTPAVTDLNILTRQLAIVDDQDFRREVADYFTSQSAISAASGLAPAEVESMISTLRADAGDGATVAQQQIISGVEEAQKVRAQALKDDPLGYAINRRIVPDMPPLNLSAPDSWDASFQAYQNGVDVLRARGEVGNISALRPEIEAEVQRALSTSTPQEAVGLLGSMAANMRPETYQATLNSIAAKGDGRAVAAAGALVQHNPQVAESVLRGTALLRENPNLAPSKSDDNRAEIDNMLPTNAFAPSLEGARQSLLEAATARYADLSHQAGDASGDLSDVRMQQAISEVTGGVVEMNGSPVVVPKYGMTQDDFDKTVSAISDADLTGAVTTSGQRVTSRDLVSQGRLRAVADGRYVLEFGSSEYPTYVMKSDGGTFVLDMRGR